MDDNEPTTRHRYAKRVGTAAGLAAFAVMVALSIAHTASAPTSATLAGSGDAPANTTYSQPVVAGMNMGATATWSAPASTLATSMAVPPLKAAG